ncbi:Imm74 family immunity protein [Chryseobacterium gambrini]|uniref:Imm74 family immunity protein n=1 Tax=Chryseobacterium gambrini TaxID=373672 RepID=UPI0022F38EB3|nr:Imm74 family immunity protein [Chryseobacterium gambrini]WBX98253.1 Imm74 family immunity protein [Chryseobacterium gambrini]
MEIKNITGTRGSITVQIDDKIVIINGELTVTPIFYADRDSIKNWEVPYENVEISEKDKLEIIRLIEEKTRDAKVPIIFD